MAVGVGAGAGDGVHGAARREEKGARGLRLVEGLQWRGRIVVHDYSGHPGQAELSRALAHRGHHVVHQHCPSYTTGKGSLERVAGDPPTLEFEPCSLSRRFARYSVVTRLRQEVAYGRLAARRIVDRQPDVAVVSNVPLLAHAVLVRHLRRRGVPAVFWHQDIYSAAIGDTARRRLPGLGRVVARVAERVERKVARSSGAVVAISPVFLDTLRAWGVGDRATVVPNWAPIAELPERPRSNPWGARTGLAGGPVVLYAGTLGLKHDPSVLADLALQLEAHVPDARLVVVSEGRGRDWLEEWKRSSGARNLVLLDYQPYSELPDVMGSADVLVALLEPNASRFSVPSKVLTYMCAGRAVVAVVPRDNSIAEVLLTHQAGVVVEPGRPQRLGDVVCTLLGDDERRRRLGRAARRYAEATFSPERAADRFEAVLRPLVSSHEAKPVRDRRRARPLTRGVVGA